MFLLQPVTVLSTGVRARAPCAPPTDFRSLAVEVMRRTLTRADQARAPHHLDTPEAPGNAPALREV
jgi:hypothetical protein